MGWSADTAVPGPILTGVGPAGPHLLESPPPSHPRAQAHWSRTGREGTASGHLDTQPWATPGQTPARPRPCLQLGSSWRRAGPGRSRTGMAGGHRAPARPRTGRGQARPWPSHGQTAAKPRTGHGQATCRPWPSHGQAMAGGATARPWRSHGQDMAKPWPGHGKILQISTQTPRVKKETATLFCMLQELGGSR